MSLDINKLEKVRELGGGSLQARCPACAEGGQDRSGNHLKIYADGRFGCCVHAKDREHRKRIFALAGVKKSGTFTVRVKVAAAVPAVESVKAALNAFSAGTLGTAKTESEPSGKMASQASQESHNDSVYAQSKYLGTSGTLLFQLRGCTGEKISKRSPYIIEQLIDWEPAVPSVPSGDGRGNTPKEQCLPFFTADGTLVIPFASPQRYHWWSGGQTIAQTRAELLAQIHEQSGKENDATAF